MISDEEAQAVAGRVKEKLDFNLQMEKEHLLYNWGGNEVVWLLEYLWKGGRFNNLYKDQWLDEKHQAGEDERAIVEEKAKKWDQIEPMLPKITKIILEAKQVSELLGLVTKPRGENNDK